MQLPVCNSNNDLFLEPSISVIWPLLIICLFHYKLLRFTLYTYTRCQNHKLLNKRANQSGLFNISTVSTCTCKCNYMLKSKFGKSGQFHCDNYCNSICQAKRTFHTIQAAGPSVLFTAHLRGGKAANVLPCQVLQVE